MRDGDEKSKCFGFVNFENADVATTSVDALNGKFEQSLKEADDKYQGANLYIKNLDDSIDDDKLRDLFFEFGKITSYKVMRDPSGISRGSCFVAFSTPEEASRAEQFSQMRPVAMAPTVAPCMPMYPPGASGLVDSLWPSTLYDSSASMVIYLCSWAAVIPCRHFSELD
ncbi:hypothetical protein Dimus_031736 [Dionaea muscipula]